MDVMQGQDVQSSILVGPLPSRTQGHHLRRQTLEGVNNALWLSSGARSVQDQRILRGDIGQSGPLAKPAEARWLGLGQRIASAFGNVTTFNCQMISISRRLSSLRDHGKLSCQLLGNCLHLGRPRGIGQTQRALAVLDKIFQLWYWRMYREWYADTTSCPNGQLGHHVRYRGLDEESHMPWQVRLRIKQSFHAQRQGADAALQLCI
mmetsp:Transcript_15636/g.34387  ORF Transcript_15636/g.34387 Transcript_15636/m.34387 type:complete len:206 (+) Transcript_15636:1284-1901(+)